MRSLPPAWCCSSANGRRRRHACRRLSCLLGTFTLTASTLAYLAMWYASAPFWAWALGSGALGLGFTFFSGAVQAWLTDALTSTGYFANGGQLETVLAKGEIVEGAFGGNVRPRGEHAAQAGDLRKGARRTCERRVNSAVTDAVLRLMTDPVGTVENVGALVDDVLDLRPHLLTWRVPAEEPLQGLWTLL